jgi:uncharacterized radical SAM superfamily Fe-S cluster-containing enzyme
MILSKTLSFCEDCLTTHNARYEELETGGVAYVVECPRAPRVSAVSSDSVLFKRIRSCHARFNGQAPSFRPKKRFYLLEITNACNFTCPICYAEAGSGPVKNRSLEEIRSLGMRVKADGGRWVCLTGGEPTMHPELPSVIACLRQELGLSPLILTNGLRIAEDREYLLRLKRAGLRKVQLQFDTFDNETYRRMRGRTDAREKSRAVENLQALGMRIGLVATVCGENLAECGRILDYACSLAPALNTVMLQGLMPIGRCPPSLRIVNREEIIHALAEHRGRCELDASDFYPLPVCAPLGNRTHPDCYANTFIAMQNGRGYPITRDMDIPWLYERLQSCDGQGGFWRTRALPAISLIRSVRRGKRLEFLRRVQSLRSGAGRLNLFTLSVGTNMRPGTRDEERLEACPACSVTPKGLTGVCSRICGKKTRPLEEVETV